jgi:hypothetical protein
MANIHEGSMCVCGCTSQRHRIIEFLFFIFPPFFTFSLLWRPLGLETDREREYDLIENMNGQEKRRRNEGEKRSKCEGWMVRMTGEE